MDMTKRSFLASIFPVSLALDHDVSEPSPDRRGEGLVFVADPNIPDHQAQFESVLRQAEQIGSSIQITGKIKQTRPFHLHTGAVLLGNAPRLYPSYHDDVGVENPTWNPWFSTFEYVRGYNGPSFTGGKRCRIENIIFRRSGPRNSADSVFSIDKPPSHVLIRNCLFQNLEFVACNELIPWGAWQFEANTVHACSYGLKGVMVDMKVLGNTFVSLSRNALRIGRGGGLNMVALNRFEWSEAPFVELTEGCRTNMLLGNIFDASAVAGIYLNKASPGQLIAQNVFWRNGRSVKEAENADTSCHLYFAETGAHSIKGNVFLVGTPDGGGRRTPSHVAYFRRCIGSPTEIDGVTPNSCSTSIVFDCDVESSNTLHMAEVGIPREESSGRPNDNISITLLRLNKLLASRCRVKISEDRLISANIGYCENICLHGEGRIVSFVLESDIAGFSEMHDISISEVIFRMVGGIQHCDKPPNNFNRNLLWAAGKMIFSNFDDSYRFATYMSFEREGKTIWRRFGFEDVN